MFEVDAWESSTKEEQKLVCGLFGECHEKRSKRKRKKNEQSFVKEKDEKYIETAKKDTSLQSHGKDDAKKRKPSHLVTEVETAQKPSTISKPRKRKKKRKKNKEVENGCALEESAKELDGRIIGKEKKKSMKKEKSNDNFSIIDPTDKYPTVEGSVDKDKEITEKFDNLHEKNSKLSSVVSAQQAVGEKEKSFPRGSHSRKSQLQEKLKKKLESSRFRWINEQLYTIPGEEALSLFTEDQSLFEVYHKGFRRQVEQWPINPVDVIIDWINQRSSSLVLADFGCGEALIAQTVPNKVFSFDLVAKNKLVTACNMAKVPLNSACIDVAIFCLSLMGTDLEAFLREAYRVLKPGQVFEMKQ
ncbi:hypothetical protein QZH41_020227 [Actinostola sp. cb2023]|nr:hypothetical protein QZH41_020227 [Actinostola sp. cb2023]